MPHPITGRRRRTAVRLGLAATGVVALATTTFAMPAGASRTATVAPNLVGGLVDFGCANAANHLLAKLLPATPQSARNGVTCFGRARAAAGKAGPAITKGPVGYGPAQIQSAYKLAGLHASGRTVAIVDAYDNPKAESDLATYRAAYGLPACTTANGCFRKVNQNGQASPLPVGDYGWAMEISLDLDAVSAACPDCHILLVEANTPDTAALMTAVDTAVRLGAVAVSNSYGGVEDGTILAADAHLNHPGVAITAATGDGGYGVSWPASSPYVTAAGGTTLNKATNARGWTETVWSGAGSGCSAYEPKPAWQTDTGCAKRTVGDVSADADPNTGLGVYDSYNSCGTSSLCDLLISLGLVQGADGWIQVGGTSLSSPLVASVYALAGNSVTHGSYPYSHSSSLFDVTSGSNGSCGGSYLCTGKPGYDGPTGLGTPNGTGAF
ncbi:MAG: peptidase and in kexin sedolisin [Pseudonocardiales bacterium]|nr:peptidase and in kexin sedolisin [Pseudonocardiales bacterium]